MIAYLGIGTNLGDRNANIRTALSLLHERTGELLRCSAPYHSAPVGFVSDNAFVNVVASFRTPLTPRELLAATQNIERTMGRTEKSVNGQYRDRIIDIDLLLCFADNGEPLTCSTPDLTLPHPRMQERDFVMVPLREIYKDTLTTQSGQTATFQQGISNPCARDAQGIEYK